MKFKLKNVIANPFRDLKRYPIKREKIDALKKSIQDTEFWENIVGRKVGDKVEIAYGHHRLVALRELYVGSHEINIIVRSLDDTRMAQIMAHENMDEWASQADVEQETVRAIVQGYADGRIDLEIALEGGQKRYAPSFLLNTTGGKEILARERNYPYTTEMLTKFLGWGQFKVSTALKSLEAIERADIAPEIFVGLSTKQAEVIVAQLNRSIKAGEVAAKRLEKADDGNTATKVRREAKREAKEVANAIKKGFKEGKGTRDATEIAERVRLGGQQKPREIPDINKFAPKVAKKLSSFLNSKDGVGEELKQIVRDKKHLSERSREGLVDGLSKLEKKANEFKSKF